MRNATHEMSVMVTGMAFERVMDSLLLSTWYRIQLTETMSSVPARREKRDLIEREW